MPMLHRSPERAVRQAGLALMLMLALPAAADTYTDTIDAARLGRTADLAHLLDLGMETETIDPQGNTLLILAARDGYLDTVRMLIERRARLDKRNLNGDSALMLAVLRAHAAVVEVLLAAGAALDYPGAWGPLHYAAFEGHLDMVERLLAAGADVNALTPNLANPLMLAARNGHIDVVRRLLATPVDLRQKTDLGLDAQAWAREAGNTDIADLIAQRLGRRAP